MAAGYARTLEEKVAAALEAIRAEPGDVVGMRLNHIGVDALDDRRRWDARAMVKYKVFVTLEGYRGRYRPLTTCERAPIELCRAIAEACGLDLTPFADPRFQSTEYQRDLQIVFVRRPDPTAVAAARDTAAN